MKIILFSRPLSETHREKIVQIFAAIEQYGFDFTINREAVPSVEQFIGRTIATEKHYGNSVGEITSDAVMVCYGGDGTLLEGVHRLDGNDIPVVGINSGRLGFLALAQSTEIDEVFKQIAENKLLIEKRAMIAITGNFEGKHQTIYALNEVAVQRLGATMISVDISIDSMPTLTCNGDGVIISTPTGSTAYSLSVGGPIMMPENHNLIIAPVASHSLNVRPLIIPDNWKIDLKVSSRSHSYLASIDGRSITMPDTATISISKADYTVRIIRLEGHSFLNTLKTKLMWGADVRS